MNGKEAHRPPHKPSIWKKGVIWKHKCRVVLGKSTSLIDPLGAWIHTFPMDSVDDVDGSELVESQEGVTQPYRRLTDYQLDAMAILCVEGISPEEISQQTGVDRDQVLTLIRGGRNKQFDRLVEGYKKKITTAVVSHRFKLMDLLDDAYLAVDNAINNGDSKLRADTAWKLFDQVVPRVKEEQDSSLKIVINNPTVQAEMGKTINNIHESLDEMVDALKRSDESKHVLIGDEALPIPPVQLEISDAEALPSMEEAEKNLDLEVLDE